MENDFDVKIKHIELCLNIPKRVPYGVSSKFQVFLGQSFH